MRKGEKRYTSQVPSIILRQYGNDLYLNPDSIDYEYRGKKLMFNYAVYNADSGRNNKQYETISKIFKDFDSIYDLQIREGNEKKRYYKWNYLKFDSGANYKFDTKEDDRGDIRLDNRLRLKITGDFDVSWYVDKIREHGKTKVLVGQLTPRPEPKKDEKGRIIQYNNLYTEFDRTDNINDLNDDVINMLSIIYNSPKEIWDKVMDYTDRKISGVSRSVFQDTKVVTNSAVGTPIYEVNAHNSDLILGEARSNDSQIQIRNVKGVLDLSIFNGYTVKVIDSELKDFIVNPNLQNVDFYNCDLSKIKKLKGKYYTMQFVDTDMPDIVIAKNNIEIKTDKKVAKEIQAKKVIIVDTDKQVEVEKMTFQQFWTNCKVHIKDCVFKETQTHELYNNDADILEARATRNDLISDIHIDNLGVELYGKKLRRIGQHKAITFNTKGDVVIDKMSKEMTLGVIIDDYERDRQKERLISVRLEDDISDYDKEHRQYRWNIVSVQKKFKETMSKELNYDDRVNMEYELLDKYCKTRFDIYDWDGTKLKYSDKLVSGLSKIKDE